MNTINWYDWITPSSPFAAIVLGLIIMLIATFSYWYETRKMKEPLVVFVVGALVVVMGAYLLQFVGFYK